MFKKFLVATCVAALTAGTAGATIVNLTYSGTVNYGTDYGGEFGTQYASLSGDFVAKFHFDTTKGTLYTAPYGSLFGGALYGSQSPLLSAGITINGLSFAYTGANLSQLQAYDFGTQSGQRSSADDGNGSYMQFELFKSGSAAFGSSSFAPYDGDVSAYVWTAYFQTASGTYGNLHLAHLKITNGVEAPPAVPEPASWAMMVGGFGMIGGALRGRKKAAVSFG